MKKSLPGTVLTIIFIAALLSVTGCKKAADTPYPVPVVGTSNTISQLTSTSVIAGGIRINVDIIASNGVCWSSTNQLPTTADSKTTDTVAVHWVSKITGLTPNTTYYLRAYAVGTSGTGYGGVITFKTNATSAIPVGTVTTIAGNTSGNAGYADGSGAGVLFDSPQYLSYNSSAGLLYVSDTFNNLIRTVTTTGTTRTLTNPTIGHVDGPLSTAQFYGPRGMSFDAQGNTYIADIGNNMIRKITPAGVVSTFAGNGFNGYVDGAASAAEFYNPQATVVDAQGNVYVADRSNNLIRKITPAGIVSKYTGYLAVNGYPQTSVAGLLDGDANTALFNRPVAMAIDQQGNIFVADQANNAIRKVTPDGYVTTYAGGANFPGLLGTPSGIAVDAQGNLFFTDSSGRVFEITSSKVLYLLAGAQNTTGFSNGVGSAARFNNPQGITLDAQGNLYIADFGNNVIRKIVVTVQ
jgi:sugar lactone lactonase YvrE